MRAWFSIRVFIVGLAMAIAYAPFVWFAVHMGVPLPAVIGGVGIALVAQYYIGTKRALREANATRLDATDEGGQHLYQATNELADRLNVPEPTIWVSNLGSPNAFAIGRKGNGHIVLDIALLRLLSPDEIHAVIAHELSHLRSRDVIPMVIGSGGAVIAYYLLASVESLFRSHSSHVTVAGPVGHTVMMFFVFAISREREYIADADAKWAVGSGEPLANALAKIEGQYDAGYAREPPDGVEAFCIAGHWSFPALGSTHPDTSDRITQLLPETYDSE